MANEKISELTPTWSPWISDIIPIVQGWVNKQAELWDLPISTATQTALNTKQNTSEKWQPNWYASLDWSWKVPTSQLPWWTGNWDVVWPNSSTDNAIVRYNWTTWKLIKNSSAIIDDSWNILATNLSWTNTWDETKATIESKLIWDISSHTHDWRYYTETEINSQLSKVYWTWVTSYITLTFTATTFSISDGTWVITNWLTWAISNISWSWLNNVTDNFPTSDTTWLLIDSSWILTQQASIPTPTEYRTKILVWAIWKNAWNIIFWRTVTLPHYDWINAITDISTFLGAIQDWNINILWTWTLTVNYTAWKVFSLWANATSSVYWPNIVPLSSQTPATLNAVYRNWTWWWTIWPNVTIINSALYDNWTWTLAPVVSSKYTIKVFYLSSTGKVYVQQWQNIYNSLSEATAAVNTEIRENWPYWSSLVKLWYVVIKSWATATNNTTDCAIINLGKFWTGWWGWWSWWITDHNSLTWIQGWAIWDYQHLTTAQVTALWNAVPKTRTLTINWTTYDLSADRSWTISWWSTQIRKMFAIAWTIWATGTNVANTIVMDWTYTLSKCNLWYWTAWNGTLTIDVNKNWTTVYNTTKPSITWTNQTSINSWTITTAWCVSWDIYTLDIDAVPWTTFWTDLYVELVFTS